MTESAKKLEELRVVDLKNELERRGFDKSGVKATLLERLKQVLEKEGKDPESFIFAVTTDVAMSPPKKASSRRKSGKPNEADVEEDETPATFESFNELVATEGGDHHEDSGEENNEAGEGEIEEANDQSEPIVEDEEIATANDSGAEMEGGDEESDEQVEENKMDDEAVEHNGIDQQEEEQPEPIDEQLAETENEGTESRAIPNPELVEPQCMFTSEDTINLHRAAEETSRADAVSGANNAGSKNDHIDDASSMMVNVDETTSELSDVASQVDQANKRRIISNDNKSEEPVAKKVASEEASDESKGAPPSDSAVKTDAEQAEAKLDAVSKTKTETPGKKIDATNKSPECSMWIIGLPSTIKAAELKSLFSKYGRVATAKVMSSKSKTDGPQWFGFITMGSPDEASKCITNLHRTELHGKMISVEKASDSKGNPVQLRKLANAPTPATSTPVATATTDKPAKVSAVETKKDSGAAVKKPSSAKPGSAAAAGTKTTADKTKTAAKKVVTTKTAAKSPATAAKADDKKEKTAADGEKLASDKSKEATESKDKPDKEKETSDKDKEKDKEEHKTRSVSRTRSTKSAHERHSSSKDHKSESRSKIRAIRYRESRGSIASRRGFVPSRGPSRGYRGSTRGFSSRGYRGGAPSTYSSRYTGGAYNYASPISSGVGYRSVTEMPVIDSRNNREHIMIERMRQREEEHRRREEQLRLEREKERLRFEREKLDRERLELQHQRQHMRMAMAYERSAVMNATQSIMGVKRAYEGLDPYAAAAQEAKRPNYGTAAVASSGGQRSSRRTPPRSSYPDRDNYRGGRGSSGRGSGISARNAGGRYSDSRSSRDTSNGRASSSSRRSRYDMPSSRRQGGGDVDAPRQSASSWDRPGRSAAVESALALTDVGGWSTAAPGAVTSVSSQWRAMPGTSSTLYSGGPSTGSLLYASLGSSGGASGASAAYLSGSSSAADRFDAYKYSSSRRY